MMFCFSEMATICMNCNLFNEALKQLQTVIRFEKRDWNRVLPIVNEVKCYLAVKNKREAESSTAVLVSLLKKDEVVEKLEPISIVCDKELDELINKFCDINSINTAFELMRCRIVMVKKTLQGQCQIAKTRIGRLFDDLCCKRDAKEANSSIQKPRLEI